MKCEYCGKEFERKSSRGIAPKYCSRECCRSADRDNKRIKYSGKREEVCRLCGKNLPKNKTCFCSRICNRRWRSIYIEQKSFEHGELIRKCIVCGKEFKTWRSGKLTCSTECSNRAHDSDKRLRGKVIDKDITLKKIAVRDHDQCQLCGLLVNWTDYEMRGNKKIYGNYYPSKDHIIPLSVGGMHAWNNVQLAHRICNSRKQNKVL